MFIYCMSNFISNIIIALVFGWQLALVMISAMPVIEIPYFEKKKKKTTK